MQLVSGMQLAGRIDAPPYAVGSRAHADDSTLDSWLWPHYAVHPIVLLIVYASAGSAGLLTPP